MAFFHGLRLVSLAVLMLVSQLDSASAAVRVFDLYARGLNGDLVENFLDPYVKVWCGPDSGQTGYIQDDNNPIWSVQFIFSNCNLNDELRLELWDSDTVMDEHFSTCIGRVRYGTNSRYCDPKIGSLFFKTELIQ
ncbi:hypothetical protein R3I94_009341 [Phoxinus phoxinus]